ncbi:MAG: hypothetical protein GQ572_01690 [Gammaproteobacteria bacterium]|nr:hypothetical protein [Gammaproteobacteria bacterium]
MHNKKITKEQTLTPDSHFHAGEQEIQSRIGLLGIEISTRHCNRMAHITQNYFTSNYDAVITPDNN